jgi:hypothetical protein
MPARGVTESGDAIQIQIVGAGLTAQRVGRAGDILERAGIAAALLVNAAIFDVPDGEATLAQILRSPVHQRAVGDLLLPASAMDHQHDGVWPGAIGQPEVSDVGCALAPLNGSVSARRARDPADRPTSSGARGVWGVTAAGGCWGEPGSEAEQAAIASRGIRRSLRMPIHLQAMAAIATHAAAIADRA